MKILWDCETPFNTPPKTYKTWANARKAAENAAEKIDCRIIIAATPEGRFYPVAIGEGAFSHGLHFHLCVAN